MKFNVRIAKARLQPLYCLFLVFSLLSLSGCAWLFGDEGSFRSRDMDYQSAEEVKPLILPDDVTSVPRKELYPIPSVENSNHFSPETSDDIPRPQSLLAFDELAGIELRTDGQVKWLVVDKSYDSLWVDLMGFLDVSGMGLASQDETLGLLETVWLQPKQEQGSSWQSFLGLFKSNQQEVMYERFRIKLVLVDAQIKNKIYVDHVTAIDDGQGLPESDKIIWPGKPAEPALVESFFDGLDDFIANKKGRKVYASASSEGAGTLRHVITKDGNGYPVLMLQMDFNKAWVDIGTAIKAADIDITDLNLSFGVYYITLKGGDNTVDNYELKLVSTESGVQIAVQIDDETLAPIGISRDVLERIKAKLD